MLVALVDFNKETLFIAVVNDDDLASLFLTLKLGVGITEVLVEAE